MLRWKRKVGAVVLMTWLVATAAGYWWYQARYLQPYQPQAGSLSSLDAEGLKQRFETAWENLLRRASGKAGRMTLIHFSQPNCRCSSQSRSHLADLYQTFGDRMTLVQAGRPESGDRPSVHPQARQQSLSALWAMVPSVPSAALFDASGELIYFGPYSSGPACGTGVNFVDNRLRRMRNDERPEPWVNDMAFGCFCRVTHQTT